MSKNLMIIESPNKIKTISKFLKNDEFEIMATYGHLRNLSKRGMGFNRETLEPVWEISDDNKISKFSFGKKPKTPSFKKNEIIKDIIKAADKAEHIYLASDPDREGEAISWHIYELLSLENKKKCKRVVFNEITQSAVDAGLNDARDIFLNWVHSYFARRLLDREIGFKLSSVVKSRMGGISAGRVQSVALKFLRDRENEIKKFVPENWYTLDVTLENKLQLNLKTLAKKFNDIKVNQKLKNGKINFVEMKDAQTVLSSLTPDYQLIKKFPVVTETSAPNQAYKTSTLQQDGISKLNLSSKQVEQIAQKLYEGVEIGKEVVGLITYPRTDRTDLSTTFVNAAQIYIENHYGSEYFAKTSETKKSTKQEKTPLVQGAHEAIRPTNLELTPKVVESHLSKNEYQLYCLIWMRALAALMTKTEYYYQTYDFVNNENIFHGYTRDLKFEGFQKVYNEWGKKIAKNITGIEHDEDEEDKFILQKITNLKEGEKYLGKNVEIKKHEKKPPTRFNEATLIKHLENEGIGRPSTYVSIANLVVNRYYATKKIRALIPTQLGMDITDQLDLNFSDIMNFSYTRNMEGDLDKIANGDLEWKAFLRKVFEHFEQQLILAKQKMPKKAPAELVGKQCPLCDSALVYRQSYKNGRISKFIGCSAYPKCNFIENLEKPKILEEKCPECDHFLIVRKNRRDQEFIGCSYFPKCRFIKKEPKVKKDETEIKTDKNLKTESIKKS